VEKLSKLVTIVKRENYMKRNIIEKLKVMSVLLVVTFLIVFALLIGLDRQEVVHCNELSRQSLEYDHRVFYITKVEYEMCMAHGIEIYAPIVDTTGTRAI
jgi:hypothetical protein